MDEHFELPVTWRNTEYLFPAHLSTTGYSYKIYVEILEHNIAFEPDEERNFRAVVSNEDLSSMHKLDIGLIEATAEVLEEIFRKDDK